MPEKNTIIIALSIFAGLVTVITVVRMFDGTPPTVNLSTPFDVVGSNTALRLHIEDIRSGLKHVSVAIEQGDKRVEIADEHFEKPRWLTLWRGGPEQQFDLDLTPYADREIPRKKGPATLVVTAEDYSWRHVSEGNRQELRHEFRTKFRAPRLERISSRHVINQGGAELVRYRVSDDAVSHGIEAGEIFYPGYPVPGHTDSFALLAFPYGETERIPIFLVAKDQAENQSKTPVPYELVTKSWRQRQINIDDAFVERTVHPLLAQSPEVDETGNHRDDFVAANTVLRDLTNQRLSAISKDTRPQRTWTGKFLQMSNSQVQALFADRRDYYYNGAKVDAKDHLGYDLAATKNYPVEAGNNGVVVFSGDLGLYGNTVILDHGFGLQSLYGHLASISVDVGDETKRGDVLGYTGSTGMAGGDHLHFSMLVHGQQVNPLEWWDRNWIKLHIDDRLGRQ